MENYNSHSFRSRTAAGFTLPAVLVITGALLILAVGALMVVGIERSTARSFVDRNRADLAVQAGLEDIRQLFNSETSNDDFLVIESPREDLVPASTTAPPPVPYLFIARGEAAGGGVEYRQVPLFSNIVDQANNPLNSNTLTEQVVDDNIIGPDAETMTIKSIPYRSGAKVAWLPVLDSKDKMISRYAFWVEDLQSKIDAKSAGNLKGPPKDDVPTHKRFGWSKPDPAKPPVLPFPAPGLNPDASDIGVDGRDKNPPLDSIATYLLTPDATATEDPSLPDAFNKDLVENRSALISPNSALAAAAVAPPLNRDERVESPTKGTLLSQKAQALEENFVSSVMPYDEQPLIPASPSIDSSMVNQPKLNLNALLGMSNPNSVNQMASLIDRALPSFKDRKGGFPDDYLKTLAAGAMDYADEDSDSTVSADVMGTESYRGLDAYPLISELFLKINYKGIFKEDARVYLEWEITLFVELWNHTNQPVSGDVSFSYENKGKISELGSGTEIRFDDENLMLDPLQLDLLDPTQENLGLPLLAQNPLDGRFWFNDQAIVLEPNEYRFVKTAILKYKIDVELKSADGGKPFVISEGLGFSGISMNWNGTTVQRIDKLVKQGTNASEFVTGTPREIAKANIIGHSYGPYNKFKNNMGDVRQALYYRDKDAPASDNKYPGNVSPNMRNIRNETIYRNGSGQSMVYGRVLPSEWPDGGHNVRVLSLQIPPAGGFDPADPDKYGRVLNSEEGQAPTFISNRGRFFSATELGRIFDPIMFEPRYQKTSDTSQIMQGFMPSGQSSWPSVELGAVPSVFYGGGNTLRIGRPEHPFFNSPVAHLPNLMPQKNAARLLDLFHAGKSRSTDAAERAGNTVRIEGHVNINTASVDSLRALAGGFLEADPQLSRRVSETHSPVGMAPPVLPFPVSAPSREKEADVIANAIVRGRPYTSPSEIASVIDENERLVFGNKELLPNSRRINWSDAAAEELFARVYNSTTVRSRNFRIWIVGQAVSPIDHTALNLNSKVEVLSEVRRVFTVFADPGERNADGSIDPTKTRLTIVNENDF